MNIVLDDLKAIFHGMGYTVVDGPEIEDTKHCFDMLNTLEGHPQETLTIHSILMTTSC